MAVLAVLGAMKLRDYIVRDCCRNRALPDMEALSAAVQNFKLKHGRLPSDSEYASLSPSPDFKNKRIGSAEYLTNYNRPERKAGEVTDTYGRPFQYEPAGNSFLIRSLGPDGIRSNDDFVIRPE